MLKRIKQIRSSYTHTHTPKESKQTQHRCLHTGHFNILYMSVYDHYLNIWTFKKKIFYHVSVTYCLWQLKTKAISLALTVNLVGRVSLHFLKLLFKVRRCLKGCISFPRHIQLWMVLWFYAGKSTESSFTTCKEEHCSQYTRRNVSIVRFHNLHRHKWAIWGVLFFFLLVIYCNTDSAYSYVHFLDFCRPRATWSFLRD